MDERVPRSKAPQLKKPERAFDGLNLREMADIVVSSSDITLIVSEDGMIADVAFAEGSVFEEIGKSWVGEAFRETVTMETQGKVDALLKDADSEGELFWRQVNHFTQRQADVPVNYAALSRNKAGDVIIVGRDLQKIADEQRRLLNAQLSMERAYSRLQSSELRYRQIFQASNEAMIVADGQTMKILEANSAANRLLGGAFNKLEGRKLKDILSDQNVAELIMQCAMSGGKLDDVTVSGQDGLVVSLSASVLREDRKSMLVVRLAPSGDNRAMEVFPEGQKSLKVLQNMPDGFVITTTEGRIVTANGTFAQMLQISNPDRLRGSMFDSWFDRTGVDCNVLVSNLKEHGVVRRFATTLRGEAGLAENVEIAAVEFQDGGSSVYGFVVRQTGSSDKQTPMNDGILPYSTEQLTGLVGHMSLKDVVRETTSVIERLCIEAALELTNDNRASAAQLLGLSRQSLYDKLSRYGLDG